MNLAPNGACLCFDGFYVSQVSGKFLSECGSHRCLVLFCVSVMAFSQSYDSCCARGESRGQMSPCTRASSPSLSRAHKLVASQHSPCSTFEPRHPCLGYANLQQRQRRLRRGNWCNSAIIALLEIAYIPTDIRLFPRHRRNCDRRKQGRILFLTNSAFPTSL